MKRGFVNELLYNIFRRDIGRKGMALALALMLWLIVDQMVVISQPHELTLWVVEGEDEFLDKAVNADYGFFFVLPQSIMLVDDLLDKNLKVVLSGPKEKMQTRLIGRKNITEADMGDNYDRIARVRVPIIEEYFSELREKSIGVEFKPKMIQLNLALRDHVVVNLDLYNLVLEGRDRLAAQGKKIEQVWCDPNVIEIEGPSPEIERIRQDPGLLQFESWELPDTTKTKRLGLSQEMKDKKISIRDADPLVSVTVNISEENDEMTVTGLNVQVWFKGKPLTEEQRARITIEPSLVDLVIRGPGSQIELLKIDDPELLRSRFIPLINLGVGETSTSLTFDEFITGFPKSTSYQIIVFEQYKVLHPSLTLEAPFVDLKKVTTE